MAWVALAATIVALTCPAAVTAAPGGERSKPTYAKRVVEEYRIETPHGSMYGRVVRPVVPAGVKVPVILSVTPYGPVADAVLLLGEETTEFFVPRGDARAFFDVRCLIVSDWPLLVR